MTNNDTEPRYIKMSPRDQRFYQGMAVGNQVLEAHAEVDFPDQASRVALFWFFAGALAGGEHGCRTSEDFDPFVLGLTTRAPSSVQED